MVVVVDDKVVVVDCSCAVVARGDDGLVVVSSLVAICIAASAARVQAVVWVYSSTEVVVGWGTVSIDVPASLSGCGGSSQGVVCVLVLAVEVGAVWVLEFVITQTISSVCTSLSTLIFTFSVSHSFRSAVLPHSSPSFLPSFFPSSNASFHAFSSSSFLNVSKTSFCSFLLANDFPSSYPL